MRKAIAVETIFLGTGSADGLPLLSCLLQPEKNCPACLAAESDKRNRRNQSSCLYRINFDSGDSFTILIDVGQTFANAARDVFPKYSINKIDAVLLTHEHADALGGLSLLRDFKRLQPSIKVFCNKQTEEYIRTSMPWVVSSIGLDQTATGPGLDLVTIPDCGPFTLAEGLTLHSLPAHHGTRGGKPFICTGFFLPLNHIYISDANVIPPETYAKIRELQGTQRISVAILDGYGMPVTSTHLNSIESPQCAAELDCQRTYLTQIHHYRSHVQLQDHLRQYMCPTKAAQTISLKYSEQRVWIQPAYDGLYIHTQSKSDNTVNIRDSSSLLGTTKTSMSPVNVIPRKSFVIGSRT